MHAAGMVAPWLGACVCVVDDVPYALSPRRRDVADHSSVK